LEGQKQYASGWEMSFNLEYDYLASGEQKDLLDESGAIIYSALTGDPHTPDPMEYDLDNGFGVRGMLKLTRKRKDLDFFVEPFIRYWEIHQTEPNQVSSEAHDTVWYHDLDFTDPIEFFSPENKTLETGMRFGLAY
jgi:hypothetical protein